MSRLPTDDDTLATLPICPLDQSVWLRVSADRYETPIHWSVGSQGRFTPETGHTGTLYLASDVTGALAESICRHAVWTESHFRFTPAAELEATGLYEVNIPAVRVLDLTVPNLAKYQLDAQIWSQRDVETGYKWGPFWATKAIELGLDGIQYFSRSHTASKCLALFGRKDTTAQWRLRCNLTDDAVLEVLDETFDWRIV